MTAKPSQLPAKRILLAEDDDSMRGFLERALERAGYEVLAREVTAERVQAYFAAWLPGTVDCWPLPNLLAVKLVLRNALQGGGARNLRLDNLGKSMGGALLRMNIELSDDEWAQCRAAPRVGWWP